MARPSAIGTQLGRLLAGVVADGGVSRLSWAALASVNVTVRLMMTVGAPCGWIVPLTW